MPSPSALPPPTGNTTATRGISSSWGNLNPSSSHHHHLKLRDLGHHLQVALGIGHAGPFRADHLDLDAGAIFSGREFLRELESRDGPAQDQQQNGCHGAAAGNAQDH